jgi:hypothetical protein
MATAASTRAWSLRRRVGLDKSLPKAGHLEFVAQAVQGIPLRIEGRVMIGHDLQSS